MKVGDRFAFYYDFSVVCTIYFISQDDAVVSYVGEFVSSGACGFDFFKEHAIILSPLLEELL